MQMAEKKTIYGKSIRTSNRDMASIMELWNDVLQNKPQGALYAVYYNYESDHTGAFDLLIGSAEQETGGKKIDIRQGNYHVVQVDASDPAGVAKAWQDIWANEIPRTYGTDFEIYREDGSIQIYLSV